MMVPHESLLRPGSRVAMNQRGEPDIWREMLLSWTVTGIRWLCSQADSNVADVDLHELERVVNLTGKRA